MLCFCGSVTRSKTFVGGDRLGEEETVVPASLKASALFIRGKCRGDRLFVFRHRACAVFILVAVDLTAPGARCVAGVVIDFKFHVGVDVDLTSTILPGKRVEWPPWG